MAMAFMMMAPGARVLIRDAEWLVRKVDKTETDGQALHVVGLSELVRDREAIFLSEAEDVKVLDPADTTLVPDDSPGFIASRLYLESLLRKTPPTDGKLYVGHRAAMDTIPYQQEPAALALAQPRQRILIADAVGLGKTLSCGVLLSELIRRGKGKRILVVAIKSLLTQFQKEMWTRFSIPLTRLDSVGIQRVRNEIPSNHNPFHYHDKAIISVDTLKQESDFRVHLENAHWDIIVIDEAHNVAERGGNTSQRAKLAKLLRGRSDTMILLSATPHDGKARSFASLMNMLDPTAIANPEEYGREDIKGLFIRRFKKDIKDQVTMQFKEREIRTSYATATDEEEEAFRLLANLRFEKLDAHRGAGQLFRTTLEKALFSSPMACLETVNNRIKRISKATPDHPDLPPLQELGETLSEIGPREFSKFQHLVSLLTDKKGPLYWTGKAKADRLVIFAERVETVKFLANHLPKAIPLKEKAVKTLLGTMSDTEQQGIVEAFGQDTSDIRLLIATDVASEGINLHYLSHRMIHFDIPWSLMVFQQRNGRIDRYGQTETPQITYLMTEAKHPKIRGDQRILELLIDKDMQAQKNIGDPSAFQGVYETEKEEEQTAANMEAGKTREDVEAEMEARLEEDPDSDFLLGGDDLWDMLTGQSGELEAHTDLEEKPELTGVLPTLFPDDFAFAKEALDWIRRREGENKLNMKVTPKEELISFDIPKDLETRFKRLPREIRPELDPDTRMRRLRLTSNVDLMQQEIKRSRKEETAWPKFQFLWELHPALTWMTDKVVAGFKRHEAPVLVVDKGLALGETLYLLSGLYPNRKGQPVLHHWFGAVVKRNEGVFDAGVQFVAFRDLATVITDTGLGTGGIPNRNVPVDIKELESHLGDVIRRAREEMISRRADFNAITLPELEGHLERLDTLRKRHQEVIQMTFEDLRQKEKRETRTRETDRIFGEYRQWMKDTMETEETPYIQVAAVLTRV